MYWEASVRVVIRVMVLISALQLTKPGAGSSDYEVCLLNECEPAGSLYSLAFRLSRSGPTSRHGAPCSRSP